MGYLHIENLYKNTDIMTFKECYSLEKIHGTSAHISWKFETKEIILFSGGEKHGRFKELFDEAKLKELFLEKFPDYNVTLFGEAYGGSQQGMSHTYGKELKFIVFDVTIGDNWQEVPNAEDITKQFGLEFVDYHKVPTDLDSLNKERDLPSTQAKRNGIEGDKLREGVVLRPLIEVTTKNGSRVIVKHKANEFMETKTPREVDPAKLKMLEDAREIAEEWVTPMRLTHVLDKLENPTEIEDTGKVIKTMISDVYREAQGEIKTSREVTTYIGKKTAELYKKRISKLGP